MWCKTIRLRPINTISVALLSFWGLLAKTCVSLNTQPSKGRPTFIDINSNEPLYYPLLVTFCNDSYIQLCVSDKVRKCEYKCVWFNVKGK